MRRWLSLGGWCGPSLMLSKLGIRPQEECSPFDMVRCTLDGIVQFTRHGFDSGFFPGPLEERPFVPDPVSIWLLFRSQHACFTHFDLNADVVVEEFQRRIAAWEAMLDPSPKSKPSASVTFLRTVLAEDPLEEIELLPRFHDAIREKTKGTLPFRTVLIVHDQGLRTEPILSFPLEAKQHSPCILWNLGRDRSTPDASLFDQCHSGYQEIITTMAKEMKWKCWCDTQSATCLPSIDQYAAKRSVPGKPLFTPYTELSKVEGVPAVRGTCKGFGSTLSASLGKCVYCGSTDGHAVPADAFDTHRPWSDKDEMSLLLNYAMHNGDEIAAVEACALEQKRGANETWGRLRQLLSGPPPGL